MKINDGGWQKINFANAYGEALNPGQGGDYARQIFAETFALDIPYYARVDFRAFTEIIDAIGGVYIDAQKNFTDSAYPGPNASYQTISFAAGRHLMSGERALQFARSRHGNNGEGSDFARAKRQQMVLMALKEKLLSFGTYTNPARVQQIISALSEHISTNLDFGQMMYLASLAREVDGGITNMVLDNNDGSYLENKTDPVSGSFLLFPRSGNFDEINAAIRNIFAGDAVAYAPGAQPAAPPVWQNGNASIFPNASVEIQNGTWRVGLASRQQKKLAEKGWAVIAIGNALQRPQTKTAIYLIRHAVPAEAVAALEKEFGLTASRSLPAWLAESYDDPATPENESGLKSDARTDILIVLGEDAQE